MKKAFLSALAIMALFCLSCSEDYVDGDWPPIIVSSADVKNEALNGGYFVARIPKEGSSFNLKVENYSYWWVSSIGILSLEDNMSSTTADYKIVYIFHASEEKDTDNLQCDGWYKIQTNDNSIAVSIPENQSRQRRSIQLGMTVGDAFTNIYIEQAASD